MPLKLSFGMLHELGDIHVRQAVEIFVSSFYEPLSFISSDVDVIADVLEHSFLLDHYHVAILEGNVVGVVAISSSKGRSHHFKREVLQSHLGYIRGVFAYMRLKTVLEQPIPLLDHQCYIESVATDSAFRGKGVSYQMQSHLLSTLPYSEYLLEVAETNLNAIRLYEKLGFELVERKKQKSFWKPNAQGGKVYMRKRVVR